MNKGNQYAAEIAWALLLFYLVSHCEVENGERKAVKYKQGEANAQFNLAVCYEDGIGVEKDEQKAVEWYKKAAKQGDVKAQNNLALCYEDGIGVEKDEKQAVE